MTCPEFTELSQFFKGLYSLIIASYNLEPITYINFLQRACRYPHHTRCKKPGNRGIGGRYAASRRSSGQQSSRWRLVGSWRLDTDPNGKKTMTAKHVFKESDETVMPHGTKKKKSFASL